MRPEERTPITRLILLVDDDFRVRTLLADMLEMLDHRVEMAGTGEEALTLLAARSYDVVLTDFQLPGMDGAELYQRIEQQWPHLARRVAFVTGRAPNDLGSRSGDASVPILGKPFTFESVEAAIAAVLSRAT
jgi:DNA-binding response OmpR family regulator